MKFILLSSVILLNAGTVLLWKNSTYNEQVSGFFINPSQQQLLVAGIDHSDQFQLQKNEVQVLQLSNQLTFDINTSYFSLNSSNQIQGILTLSIPITAIIQPEITELLAMEFNLSDDKNTLSRDILLRGQRYKSELKVDLNSLSKPHRLSITGPVTAAKTAKRLILTPATLAMDATFVPIALATSLVGWGFLGIAVAIEGGE